MKKCARCGLLNDDTAEACGGCGFVTFEEKPGRASRPKPDGGPGTAGVAIEREGAMVTLKCRTPGEAYLVIENLQSADVIALLPDEEEMVRQYNDKGYVELKIPAEAYDSAGDIRSAVEFAAPQQDQPTIGIFGKVIAFYLGFLIVPGLLLFVGLLRGYKKQGEDLKAKELKLWFCIGVISLLLFALLGTLSK